MSTIVSKVQGMTCQHCVGSVTKEVSAIPGVSDVSIDLQVDGLSVVSVESDTEVSDEQLSAAIAEAGYELMGTPTRS
jgi:copper chaperone CopZ